VLRMSRYVRGEGVEIFTFSREPMKRMSNTTKVILRGLLSFVTIFPLPFKPRPEP